MLNKSDRRRCDAKSIILLQQSWNICWIYKKHTRVWSQCFYLGCTTQITHHLTNVLDNGHIVFPAIIPKLRGGKLSFQKNSWAWNTFEKSESLGKSENECYDQSIINVLSGCSLILCISTVCFSWDKLIKLYRTLVTVEMLTYIKQSRWKRCQASVSPLT